MLRRCAFGTSTTPRWHLTHCDWVAPRASIGWSQWCIGSYDAVPEYRPQAFSCSLVEGVWAAVTKVVPRPRPR